MQSDNPSGVVPSSPVVHEDRRWSLAGASVNRRAAGKYKVIFVGDMLARHLEFPHHGKPLPIIARRVVGLCQQCPQSEGVRVLGDLRSQQSNGYFAVSRIHQRGAVELMPQSNEAATKTEVTTATRLRRANLVQRYTSDGDRATIGSSFRNLCTSIVRCRDSDPGDKRVPNGQADVQWLTRPTGRSIIPT